jgi:hypothetical protein
MGMTTISDERLAELALAAATLDCDEADEIVEALMELESRRKEEAERPKEWGIRSKVDGGCRGPFTTKAQAEDWVNRFSEAYELVWQYRGWFGVEPQARTERED